MRSRIPLGSGLVVAIALTTGSAAVTARVPLPSPPARADTGTVAPELTNDSWLNSDHPLTLAELRGRVVLLNFWVFTCGNCTRSLPSLVDFDDQYRARGLTIIGIHTPEFPPYSGEHDRENVRRAVRAHGIRYPVAQDNDRRTWDAYDIRYWPSFVLIDGRGRIRYEGYGEFHENDDTHQEWSRRIERLLDEQAPALRVRAEPAGARTRLVLLADSGARINARAKPALELADGTVLHFDSPHLTPDSAYFTAAPTTFAPAGARLRHATLRASVCPAGARYCRSITLPVDP
jgi:thiol-disulfide isomerase/thioredoxin